MGDDEPAPTLVVPSADKRRLLWHLLRWYGPCLLAVLALAAVTESSILTGLAVLILACVLSRLCLWHALTTEAPLQATPALYFWSYGAAVVLFAFASGVTLTLAALADGAAPPELNWPLDVLLPAGWCAAEAMGLQTPRELPAKRVGHTASVRPQGIALQPVHVTLGIEAFAVLIATGATAVGAGLSHVVPSDLLEIGSTAVIALAALFAAAQFALEMRRLISGVPIDPEVLRGLTAAVGRAAEKTGAIRAVQSVEAIHTGPGTVLAIIQLEFKDGVAAQHLAPVMTTLRAAARAEVPEATDVLLAPPPLKSIDKGSH